MLQFKYLATENINLPSVKTLGCRVAISNKLYNLEIISSKNPSEFVIIKLIYREKKFLKKDIRNEEH